MIRSLLITIALLSFGAEADECQQVAQYMREYEKELQVKYMQTHLPPAQWQGFLKASTQILNDLYQQRVELCRDEQSEK